MSTVTKPLLLDETGKAIVAALQSTDIVQQRTQEINQYVQEKLQEVQDSLPPDYNELLERLPQVDESSEQYYLLDINDIDKTLTCENMAADAKATGDALAIVKSDVGSLKDTIVEEYQNLLDSSTFEPNTSNTVISGYMEVEGGATYGFLMYGGYWELRTHDKDKNQLSSLTVTASSYASNQIQTFAENVAFIRVVVLTDNQSTPMCIKKGDVVPPYKPYVGATYSFVASDYAKPYDFSEYGLAYIQNNRLKANVWTNEQQTAVYSCVDARKDCHEMSCKAYWSSDTTNSTVAIIATKRHNKNVTDVLVKSLHPVFTRTGVKVDLLDNNAFTPAYAETYDAPLVSGVEYEFGWKITDAHTIVIKTATGEHAAMMPDHDLTEYIGQYCILEHYAGGGATQEGMPWFTEWKAYDALGSAILFDIYSRPDGVLQTTLNGLPYYQFSTHDGWRVTN